MKSSTRVGKRVRDLILASRGADNLTLEKPRPKTEPQVSFELFKSLTGRKARTQKELILGSTQVVRACGVYFLIKDNEIVYVGQSTNVMRRVGAHVADNAKDFDRWSFISVPVDKLDIVESFYIHYFTPKQNGRTANSKGRTEYPLAPISLKHIVVLQPEDTENA